MTKPHTITEEILKEFRDEFFTAYSQLWKSNDNGIGSILANGLDVERFLVEALHRKDEEWKEKVKSLRMENMRWCPRCKRDSERNGFTLHSDCPHPELMYRNQAIDEFNKKLDELLK